MKPTRDELIECFDVVFPTVHSGGFKESEMKALIYDDDYRFLERPKEGWEHALRAKLNDMGYDLDDLRMNTQK